jgi:hypothetical protein
VPREIKIVSLSFLDLLCCAFGGTILLCFLIIASIRQAEADAFRHRWLMVEATVWLDATEEMRTIHPGDGDPQALLKWISQSQAGDANNVPGDPAAEKARKKFEQYRPAISVRILPLSPNDQANAVGPVLNPEAGPINGLKPVYSNLSKTSDADVHLQFQSRVSPPQWLVSEALTPSQLSGNTSQEENAPVISGQRLFCRYDVQLTGVSLSNGHYFFDLFLRSHPLSKNWTGTQRMAARMDLAGSGVAGRVVLSTHQVFPREGMPPAGPIDGWLVASNVLADPDLRDIYKDEQSVLDAENRDLEHFRLRRRLEIPDRFVPEWSEGPSPPNPAATAPAFPTSICCYFDLNLDRNGWEPNLVIAKPRSAPFPDGSGTPIRSDPDNPDRLGGLWRTWRYENETLDLFLPGLTITSGRP